MDRRLIMGRSSAALGDAVLGSSSKSSCIPIYIPVFRCSPPSLACARDEARPIIWPGLTGGSKVRTLFAEPLAIWENAQC
jgi:hypothetical protein